MKKIGIGLLATVILVSGFAASAQEKAAAAPPEGMAKVDVAKLRDPFWPIDYVPPEPEIIEPETNMAPIVIEPKDPVDPEPKPKPKPKPEKPQWPKLVLKGYAGRYVILETNDGEKIGMVEQGKIATLRRKGRLYRWRIDSVTKHGMEYTELDANRIR